MTDHIHYLSCAPESYDSTTIYGVFDTWHGARDAVMNAEYVSTSAEIQEWVGSERRRTWEWSVFRKEWSDGYGADKEVRY